MFTARKTAVDTVTMIAPGTPEEEQKDTVQVKDACDAFFRSGGALEAASGGSGFSYEHRPQQYRMAMCIADAVENRQHLVIEAGTGVGKSIAYLVPLIHAAVDYGLQVVVATNTISLQEQLLYKDIPFLQKVIGKPFKAVLVKGKNNYLCLRRLARAGGLSQDLFRRHGEKELEKLKQWSREAAEGSLQELEEQPESWLWQAVNVEHGNCLWQKCPEYGACFFMNARREMQTAHLLVVNHHLFFSDLRLRMNEASILPDYSIAVLDEAHAVEDVASEHLGIRLSFYMCEHWLNRMHNADTGKGFLAALKAGHAAHQVAAVRAVCASFFAELTDACGLNAATTRRVLPDPPAIDSSFGDELDRLLHVLRTVHDDLEDLDLRSEMNAIRQRGADIRYMLGAFLEQSEADSVYWVELEGNRRLQPVMYSAPVEVGPILRDQLFGGTGSIIMTSATLAVKDNLDYFASRVGAEEAEKESVGTPFDYGRQMRVHIPNGMPDPNETEPYTEAVAQAVRYYTSLTRGRAFVLFTNAGFMKKVHRHSLEDLHGAGMDVMMQNDGMPRQALLERFRSSDSGVLFGLNSFWMGVDVRGEALSNVIITRLPFAVPDEPVTRARMDRIEEKGGSAFKDYSLPEAVLRFRQGAGRLIRSTSDSGILVVLDPRIRKKWYGNAFLAEFRECEFITDFDFAP